LPTTSACDIRGNSIAIEIATAQRNAVGVIRSAIAHADQHAIIRLRRLASENVVRPTNIQIKILEP
jgi:hypothetical protein